MSGTLLLLLYSVLFGLSLGTITFHSLATERGWFSNTSFENPKSLLMLNAFAGMVSAVVLTAYFLVWWKIPITLIGGYAIMSALLGVFRQGFWLPALLLFLMVPYAILFARPN